MMKTMNTLDSILTLEDLEAEEREQELKPKIIPENHLKLYSRCPYAFFLQEYLGLTKIPWMSWALEVLMFKSARKKLFDIRDSTTGKLFHQDLRVGIQARSLKELKIDELAEYLAFKTAESFGGSVFGNWMRIEDEVRGKNVNWNHASQKFNIGKELQRAAANYFRFIMQYGPPDREYINHDEIVDFEGTLIKTTFPELCEPMMIRDPTLWSFNADHWHEDKDASRGKIRRADIGQSALVTLRIFAYCQLAFSERYTSYAPVWGVPKKVVQEAREKKKKIDERVTYQHFNATKDIVQETHRSDSDLDLLRRFIERFNVAREKKDFPPNKDQCPSCGFNTLDASCNLVCRNANSHAMPGVPVYFLKKRNYSVEVEESENQLVLRGIMTDGSASHVVATYILSLAKKENATYVYSRYGTQISGFGLEHKLLKKADELLQKIADTKNERVIHVVDFHRNFDYRGQKNIREVLNKLGYVDEQKFYTPQPSPQSAKVGKNK